MLNILKELLTGIVSGVISSVIVTIVYTCRENKTKQIQGFKEDVQLFHRWILRVRNELEIAYKYNDVSFLKRAIEDEPILSYFDEISKESAISKRDTREYILSLVQKYNTESIDEQTFKVDMGKLYKYSVNSLNYCRRK